MDIQSAADMTWGDHQEWERSWWGDCINTFAEENKQILYAHRMGLVNEPDPYSGNWPSYDLEGKSVLDIGGGPVSMLLKCRNRGHVVVADPCDYPQWVDDRYATADIVRTRDGGEDLGEYRAFDEVWIYNVLQHTRDPRLIAENARRLAKTVRVFEWIGTPPEPGHPHTLVSDELEEWFGGKGTVEFVNENGCVGQAWHAVIERPLPRPSEVYVATSSGSRPLYDEIQALGRQYGPAAVAAVATQMLPGRHPQL